MANAIETQARIELLELEKTIYAVTSLATLTGSLHSGDMSDFGNVFAYLSDKLSPQFETVHQTYSQRVLPLVADITLSALRKL